MENWWREVCGEGKWGEWKPSRMELQSKQGCGLWQGVWGKEHSSLIDKITEQMHGRNN